MKHPTKLTAEQQQQLDAAQQTSTQTAPEFSSVEEMLRHDAIHTPVPPQIAQRLQKSAADLPPPNRSWWKRLLGGSNP